MDEHFFQDLESAGNAWRQTMARYVNKLGVVDFPSYRQITQDRIESCRMFVERSQILEQMPEGAITAELGVQEGNFSRQILDIVKPRKLHLIDVDVRRFDLAKRFEEEINAGIVSLHEGDSTQVISGFAPESFDFIYIDADHSYPGVRRDIEASFRKVVPGGHLIFNDYTFWSAAEGIPYGVVQAVNEFSMREGWPIVYFALGWVGYSDVALRRP